MIVIVNEQAQAGNAEAEGNDERGSRNASSGWKILEKSSGNSKLREESVQTK
jgi:hypothetical protein